MNAVLDVLKAVLYGERFEPADAVPRSLLREIASIPRLTGILPYLGWLPTEKLFVLDQGAFGGKPGQHLGFCIEAMPQTGSSEEMERVLASLFMTCPPGRNKSGWLNTTRLYRPPTAKTKRRPPVQNGSGLPRAKIDPNCL